MKKINHIIISLCVGMMLGMTTTAFGAPIKETVQASFEKIKFVVNGEERPLDADPLVYQGSTYLPVRTVLNALGYDVGYKFDTKTVTADKEIDTILSEANELLQREVQLLETTTPNANVDSKKIEDLKQSINSEKETIKTIEKLIRDTQERTDVSEELKNQKIEDYNKRIEFSKNMIKMFEGKLTELSKNSDLQE